MNNLPAHKNRRVLVIDDNPAIHDDFRKILSPATAMAEASDATETAVFGRPTDTAPQTQFEVDSAHQGQEGVLLVKKALEAGRPYAMAFVDVRMPPGWDGLETTRKIWELDPNFQIVLCTAYSDYSWGEMFDKIGHRDGLLILKKPFDSVEALQLAHALTEKWWLHQQSRRKMEELESRVAERTQELAKSLSMLNATFESTADGIVAVNLSGKVVSYNARFAACWQFPAEMLARRDAAEMRAHAAGQVKDSAKFLQRIKELQADPEAEGFDVIELKDGRTFERYVFPQRIDRECVGTVINWRDITERKRAEEALRESEERFSGAFEHAPIGVALVSPDGRWLKVNRALCDLVGYSAAELLTRTFQDITHPDDLEGDLENVRRMIAGEIRFYQMEKRYVHKRGHLVMVLLDVSLVRDGEGQPRYFISQIQDITARKQVEEAVQRSQKRLRDLIDGLGPSMFVGLMTPQGIMIECNRPALAAAGLKPEDVLGKPFEETHWWAYSPEVQQQLREAITRAAGGEASRYDVQVRATENHLIDVDFSLQPLWDETGEVAFLVPSASVITKRKQTETALRESNEKFHQLADNITDAFWIRSPDMREVHYVSPAFERIWGRSVESLYANPQQWADFILPEDRERVLGAFAALTGEAPSLDIEYRIVRPDSEIRWVQVRGFQVRDSADKLIRHIGIVADITERKRAERQSNVQYSISRILSESAALEQAAPKVLQAICEILNWDVGALWTMDHRAGVLRCNEIWSAPDIHVDEFKTPSRQMTFAQGLGLPGRVWASGQSAWIRDVTQDKDFTRAAAAKQAGLHGAFAFPILVGNGVDGVMEFFSRKSRESDDNLLRTGANLGAQLGLFFERRRVEENLFQSQKLETVGRLAGGIAHEFNSILTAIIGQSELLLSDLPAGSPLAKNATEISNAAERAATLTRQLLAYGRKQILQPEILDLNSVLAGMESTLRHLLGRGTDVRIAPAAGLKAVKADAGQIEQVIMNMAMNAADAMPHGGKLTLETVNVTLDQEYVSRFPELKAGDYVMLAITDTGTGMSEEAKARVFEPFFSTKGVGQGTGLGLSTCYGIIKQSGGHISVYSELARGATFKIYLPQVEPQTKIALQRLDAPDLPRGTETILLVEDDPALREMAAILLRRLGYTVLVAANGIEALSLKQQRDIGHVDLLFTDVVMPHMSGKELADRMRALYPHTRILFTSAYTENAIVHQGVLTKGVELLQKPFTPSALAHKVREILDSGKT